MRLTMTGQDRLVLLDDDIGNINLIRRVSLEEFYEAFETSVALVRDPLGSTSSSEFDCCYRP
jgi:predicted methyltransferase